MSDARLHAFLPPSGAGAWVACAAWPHMNARYPQDDSEESLEGTAAHWVAYELLYSRPVAIGQVTPTGNVVTLEMLEGADVYTDTIDADLAAAGLNRSVLYVEQRIYIPYVHVENWGTPDCWFYAPTARKLTVYDYKFGHDFVDAYMNWQCVDYTCGIVEQLAQQMGVEVSLLDQHLTVEIVVVQPRNYDRSGPVRRWTVRASDLRALDNKLQMAAARVMDAQPLATPGPHCKHCPGRHACNALQREAYKAAAIAGSSTPAELPPAALAVELAILEDAAKMLAARISGLEAETEARIRRGERMNGYALAETYGRQRWKLPADQIIAMGQLMGVNLAKVEAVTPLQAQKAGMRPELVEAYSEKPRAGVKLVRDDGTAAAKVFGKIN